MLVLQQKAGNPVLYCVVYRRRHRLNAEYADTWILKHLNIQILKRRRVDLPIKNYLVTLDELLQDSF